MTFDFTFNKLFSCMQLTQANNTFMRFTCLKTQSNYFTPRLSFKVLVSYFGRYCKQAVRHFWRIRFLAIKWVVGVVFCFFRGGQVQLLSQHYFVWWARKPLKPIQIWVIFGLHYHSDIEWHTGSHFLIWIWCWSWAKQI